MLEHVAAEAGADPSLAEVTARRVRRWLTERPVALKPGSVSAYVRPLRAFSRWCAREYRVDEPLAGLRPPRGDPPSIAVFSDDQLRTVLDGARLHLAYAITLRAETGLRLSEAVAIRLDDLDGAWLVVRSASERGADASHDAGDLLRDRQRAGESRCAWCPDIPRAEWTLAEGLD